MLFGEDNFSLHQVLEGIKKSMGDPSALATNTATFDGKELTIEQLKNACETVPFLAEKRLVIVEELLERFELPDRSGQKKTKRLPEQENLLRSFAAVIKQLPDFTVLVLIEGRVGNRNPLLDEISAKAEVKSFPLLKDVALRQWVNRRVTEAGGRISPQAVDLLVRFVGNNLWAMANEVDKLVQFANGRIIEDNDVRDLVSYVREASVFTMVDAILAYKVDVAEKLLQQLIQQGASSAYLLVMLARQASLIVRVSELVNQRKPKAEIQSRLGLTSEFALRRTLEQADRYSLARLRELYHKLLEADLSIKTGRFDGELALNILIAELGIRRQPEVDSKSKVGRG